MANFITVIYNQQLYLVRLIILSSVDDLLAERLRAMEEPSSEQYPVLHLHLH